MTHDEIISIYKEVSNKICNGTEWCWSGAGEPLKLFAKLVAAKEREALAQRTWVGLNKEEAFELQVKHKGNPFSLSAAVENLLREKNQ